jgi:hypothetical protein
LILRLVVKKQARGIKMLFKKNVAIVSLALFSLIELKAQVAQAAPQTPQYSLYIPWVTPADAKGVPIPIKLTGSIDFTNKTYSFERAITLDDQALTFKDLFFPLNSGSISLSNDGGLSINATTAALMGRSAALKLVALDPTNSYTTIADFKVSFDKDVTLVLSQPSDKVAKLITLKKDLALRLDDSANDAPKMFGLVNAFGQEVLASLEDDQVYGTDFLASFTLKSIKLSDMLSGIQDMPQGNLVIENAWFTIVNMASTQFDKSGIGSEEHVKTLPKDALVIFQGTINQGKKELGALTMNLDGIKTTGVLSQNTFKLVLKSAHVEGVKDFKELSNTAGEADISINVDWTQDIPQITTIADRKNASLEVLDDDKKTIFTYVCDVHLELTPGRVALQATGGQMDFHFPNDVIATINNPTLKLTKDLVRYITSWEIGGESKTPIKYGLTDLDDMDVKWDIKYNRAPNFPMRPDQMGKVQEVHTKTGYTIKASPEAIQATLMTVWSATGRFQTEKPIVLGPFTFYDFIIDVASNPFVGKYVDVKCKTKIVDTILEGTLRAISSPHGEVGHHRVSESGRVFTFTVDLPLDWSPAQLVPGMKDTVFNTLKWTGSVNSPTTKNMVTKYVTAATTVRQDLTTNPPSTLSPEGTSLIPDRFTFRDAYNFYRMKLGLTGQQQEALTLPLRKFTLDTGLKEPALTKNDTLLLIDLASRIIKIGNDQLAIIKGIEEKDAKANFVEPSKGLDMTQAVLGHIQLTDAQISLATDDYWSPDANTLINKGLTITAKLKSGPLVDGIEKLLGVTKAPKSPDLQGTSGDDLAQGVGAGSSSDMDQDLQGVNLDTKADKLATLITRSQQILDNDQKQPAAMQEMSSDEAKLVQQAIDGAKAALAQAKNTSDPATKGQIINKAYSNLKYSSNTISDRLQDMTLYLTGLLPNPLKSVLGGSLPLGITIPRHNKTLDFMEKLIADVTTFLDEETKKTGAQTTMSALEAAKVQIAINNATVSLAQAKKITNKDPVQQTLARQPVFNNIIESLEQSSPLISKHLDGVGSVIAKDMVFELGRSQEGVALPRITFGGTFLFKPSLFDPWLEFDGRLSLLFGFVSLSMNLKSRWKDASGVVHTEWEKPNGTPLLAIGDLALTINIGPGLPPGFGAAGALYVGDTTKPLADRMKFKAAGQVNPMMPTQNFLILDFENLMTPQSGKYQDPIASILTFLGDMTGDEKIKQTASKMPKLSVAPSGIKDLELYYVPYGAQIGTESFPPGMTLKGEIDINGWRGGGQISASMPSLGRALLTGGIRGKVFMSPLILDVKDGQFRLITTETESDLKDTNRYVISRLTGDGPDLKRGTADDGPVLAVELTLEKQELIVNGELDFANGWIHEKTALDLRANLLGFVNSPDGLHLKVGIPYSPDTISDFSVGLAYDNAHIQKYIPGSNKLVNMLGKGIADGGHVSAPSTSAVPSKSGAAAPVVASHALQAAPVVVEPKFKAQIYNALPQPAMIQLDNGDMATLLPGGFASRITVNWRGKGSGKIVSKYGVMPIILSPDKVFVVSPLGTGAQTIRIISDVSRAHIYSVFPDDITLKLASGDTVKISPKGISGVKEVAWTGVGKGTLVSTKYGTLPITMKQGGVYKLQPTSGGLLNVTNIFASSTASKARIINAMGVAQAQLLEKYQDYLNETPSNISQMQSDFTYIKQNNIDQNMQPLKDARDNFSQQMQQNQQQQGQYPWQQQGQDGQEQDLTQSLNNYVQQYFEDKINELQKQINDAQGVAFATSAPAPSQDDHVQDMQFIASTWKNPDLVTHAGTEFQNQGLQFDELDNQIKQFTGQMQQQIDSATYYQSQGFESALQSLQQDIDAFQLSNLSQDVTNVTTAQASYIQAIEQAKTQFMQNPPWPASNTFYAAKIQKYVDELEKKINDQVAKITKMANDLSQFAQASYQQLNNVRNSYQQFNQNVETLQSQVTLLQQKATTIQKAQQRAAIIQKWFNDLSKITDVRANAGTLNLTNGDLLKLAFDTNPHTVFWFGKGDGLMINTKRGNLPVNFKPGITYEYRLTLDGKPVIEDSRLTAAYDYRLGKLVQ